MNIDALLIVNETVAVIIEDKVLSSEHDDQISKYLRQLSGLQDADGITDICGDKYRLADIKAVFIKTGNFYPEDDSTAKRVKAFSRKELKELQTKMEIIRSTAHTIISGIEAEIMKETIQETETLEQKPMIPEMTVTVVQTEKPHRTISHRRR
jgi:hypothetical protein